MEGDGADRFEAFVDALAEVFGHADRVRPLRDYCMGLLTPAERKRRRAARGGDRSLAGLGATPVAAAFRGPVALVRREGPGEGCGADAPIEPGSLTTRAFQ